MEKQNDLVTTGDAVNAWLKYIERFGSSKIGITSLVSRGYSTASIQAMFLSAVKTGIPIDDIKSLQPLPPYL